MSTTASKALRASGPRHHWILYVALAFFGGLLTFVGARAQQRATDDATFRKLIDGYCTAWSTKDPANAARFYDKSDGLVFYDVAPFSYGNWKEYDAGVRTHFFDEAETVSLTAGKELRVTRHGNIAWTTVPMHLTAKMKGGQNIDAQIRYTGIWERKGKAWLLVHEHLSAPLGG